MGPSEIDGIPIGHPTLASMLRDVGYATSMIGKWHCGFLPWFSPTRLGWDEFFGNFGGGLDYFSKIDHIGTYDLYEQETEHEDLRYYTDIVTERAAEFIGRRPRQPVAAQPQLHDTALALGGPRQTRRSATSSPPAPGPATPSRSFTWTAGHWRSIRRWSRT